MDAAANQNVWQQKETKNKMLAKSASQDSGCLNVSKKEKNCAEEKKAKMLGREQ